MRRLLTLTLALSALLAPARAETTAERLQRLLWTYGDTGAGWTGGDGTYSVRLPDGRDVWVFSDTFLGPVNEDGSRPTSAPFVNNSMVVQDGETMTTLVGPGQRSLIRPPDGAGFYWVGDAVVENGELLVFVNRFVAAPIPFAFQQAGTDVARFALPSLELLEVVRMPLAFSPAAAGLVPVSYGSAILTRGGYHYVYGVEDLHLDKFLYLARVPVGEILDGGWEYWDGSGWSTLPLHAARLAAGVANELSVSAHGGELVLVTQDHAIGADIVAMTAPAPEGPWSAPRVVFTTPEPGNGRFTYNAKAHEQLSTGGKLVVTYNVNSTAPGDIYRDVTVYRPRFVEITL